MHAHEPHTLKDFDSELARLGAELEQMGELAANQLERAMAALRSGDAETARAVIAEDAAIDRREAEIGHDVLRLLALRQPVARDLREVMAALRIASDIERIGDYAANLAKRSLVLREAPAVAAAAALPQLSALACRQLREVMAAYRKRDVALALAIRERDAELDALHTTVFRGLLTFMMEDSRSIGACTHLLFIAKNIERIGDHVTNIAENIWFIEQGEAPLPERDKRDDSSSLPLTDSSDR
jgi:phosphate transport system protein